MYGISKLGINLYPKILLAAYIAVFLLELLSSIKDYCGFAKSNRVSATVLALFLFAYLQHFSRALPKQKAKQFSKQSGLSFPS